MHNSFRKKKLKSFIALTFGSLSLIGLISPAKYQKASDLATVHENEGSQFF